MTFKNITCPFCGLACDDLTVSAKQNKLDILAGQCTLNRAGFNQALWEKTSTAMMQGKEIAHATAIDKAASLLKKSEAPLIGGLITDVNGVRTAMALADACGAVIDHQDSQAIFRNTRVLQDTGWMTTTLTEVRNRADLVIMIGSQVLDDYPRFFERIIQPKPQFRKKPRQIILLGSWDGRKIPAELKGDNTTVIKTPMESVAEVIAALRATLAERVLDNNQFGGMNSSAIQELAFQLKESQYSVFTWSAKEFDMPHSELVIEQLVELIKDLNTTTRSSGLPLGGSNGSISANQVCTWQSGIPLRSSFAQGQPQHDALLFDSQRLLKNAEADLLLWVSSLRSDQPPPDTDIPTIAIGHPATQFKRLPEIFIPVGIPGIDHTGHTFRMDGVVTLPLHKLRETSLLSAADVLSQLTARIS
ncbi:MAG TPA: formylmethanofuran dehydrogenase subunit B [Chromatiales bacterium]|nr:formylmethanofuran dehydrogenase subunit B [Thiotrichales bacterium]HIP69614.1 formylmethanofuran dehydrogenase subunit B [Chromatiales bacterium]